MQRHVTLVYRNTDIPSGTSPAEKLSLMGCIREEFG